MRYLILCLLLCMIPPSALAAGAGDDPAMTTAAPHDAVLKFHEVAAPDGVPLNVVEAGSPAGPPILFLHGFSQSYMSWLPQLRDATLTARFRLVALDLRGHGASGKPWQASAYSGSKPWADDVRAVVEQLRLDRPLVVGWSFGGYVAMDYVREYGAASVAGVMLTGSHGGLVPRPPASPPNVSPDLQITIGGAQQFMKLMSASPLPKDLFDRGVAAFLMLPPYARNAMAQKRLDNTDLAGTLSVPLLAVLGGADQSQSAVALRHALAGAKQARVVVYDGVGHSAFAEATGRFDADLVGFANEVGMDNRAGDPVAVVRRYVAAVHAAEGDGALRQGRVCFEWPKGSRGPLSVAERESGK